MHDGYFVNPVMRDPLNRRVAFDYLQDRTGKLWVASPDGVSELEGNRPHTVIPGGSQLNNDVVVLCETRDGSLWAGTYGEGLWRLRRTGELRLYTVADGLSSNQIRSLVEGTDGTLWIGTFGGGLDALRNGQFFHVTARDGLLSDNVSHIEDDGQGSLWLSTTRGICRVRKQEIWDLVSGKIRAITPVNYGVADGLRSAQCAPGYPTSRGGTRSSDGRLWFPTSRGLAVLDPREGPATVVAPVVHLLEVAVDGRPTSFANGARLAPGNGRMQFRYTGIYLSAPERVRYSYRLEGLDGEWVSSVARRVTNYNSLPHGQYRFTVRAAVPKDRPAKRRLPSSCCRIFTRQPGSVISAAFWRPRAFGGCTICVCVRFASDFRWCWKSADGWRGKFTIRWRKASWEFRRNWMPWRSRSTDTWIVARKHLDLARKMVRHSLTEARRSVMDLRASALEGHDLPAALSQAAPQWTAGSPVQVRVDVEGESRPLPEEIEQHLLRIAQEAVTNAVKHARASQVRIHLEMASRELSLRVADNGRGFEQDEAFSEVGGHFGLLGMRERAERLGGELQLHSEPGQGTEVAVTVPIS